VQWLLTVCQLQLFKKKFISAMYFALTAIEREQQRIKVGLENSDVIRVLSMMKARSEYAITTLEIAHSLSVVRTPDQQQP
jgi:hypothetical protein